MRTRGLALTVVVALSIVGLLSVFGSGGSSSQSGLVGTSHFGPIPVAPGAIKTEGSPIADGFTVARGTAVVGDVFLRRAGAGAERPRMWSAVLLVTADPRAVVRAYASQALDAGFAPSPLADVCSQRFDLYTCRVQWSAGPISSRSLDLAVVRGHTATDPTSYAVLSFVGGTPTGAEASTIPSEVRIGPSPPPVPQQWTSLPTVGELLFESTSDNAVPLRVEPGSMPAAPVQGSPYYDGWTAVLRVDGDPLEVLGRYAAQLREPRLDYHGPIPAPSVQDFDGTTLVNLTAEEYGSTSYIFSVVARGSEQWLLVSAGEL